MKLARINTCLLVIIIFLNAYVVVMPFMPNLIFWWQSHHGRKAALISVLHPPQPSNTTHHYLSVNIPVPDGNRLIIPAIMLDTPFFTGPDARTLNKGPWLRPHTSLPGNGGNTVIAAHRFTYTNPRGEFYHLDKLAPGDEVGIYMNKRRYLYSVEAIKTVKADDTSVEAPTPDTRITLYTCTPLWKPKDRLVIIAKPVHSYQTMSQGNAQ